MKKRPLCTAPFLGYYWKGNQSEDRSFEGKIRPCCEARRFKDENGKTINERSVKIKDVNQNLIEHEFLQEVRASLMEGEFHPVCNDCQYREELGLVSSRANHLKHAETAEKLYPEMEYDVEKGNSLGKLFYLDYRPSNLCNLKCRMCSPYNSSLFAEEILNIYDLKEQDQYVRDIKTEVELADIYDKTNSEKLHEVLNLEDIVYIKFLGGEPLFMKEPMKMLDRIGKNAYVSFTTNATKISDEFIEKAKNLDIRKLQLGISLDGINDVYEYIRFPGKWSRVEKNLEKLFELRDGKADFQLSMTFVIQMWNAYQIPDIIRWNVDFFRRFYPTSYHNRGPFLSMVSQKYLRISNLDDHDKNWLMEELNGLISELGLHEKEIQRYIYPIMVQLEEDPNEEDLLAFKRSTQGFDRQRQQDILKIDSRYGKYMV